MSDPSYFGKYKDLAFERTDDGIRPAFQTGATDRLHRPDPRRPAQGLEEVALDADNKAMIITGTGAVFMDNIDGASLGEIFRPAVWEKIRTEGLAVLQRFSACRSGRRVANGPATVHSEYLLLTRHPHRLRTSHLRRLPAPSLRYHRRRRPAVSGRRLSAPHAPSGCCGTGRPSTPPRRSGGAWSTKCCRTTRHTPRLEIARKLAAKPRLYRSLQKQTLNQRLLRRIVEAVPFGMALEGLTAADLRIPAA